ncbi:MAG: radical SAM protein [Candidatus Niameybacter stercoravium]|nr:radical SAM protein [Candidatus Niameybacter stercoravium]
MDKSLLKQCTLCPRECKVNRLEGQLGFCRADGQVEIARAALHYWEEPCLSGEKGSGTIFFSHCTLGCVFCQNYEISTMGKGKVISIERLADICLELQAKGAYNINFVTPTHYTIQIIEAIKLARAKGLHLPIVYNTSGYEKVETLKRLEGYVDIYLPDFKYFKSSYGKKYSRASRYSDYAKAAIQEMVRQVGTAYFNEAGMMVKGVIVRHLMLPGLLFDSKHIVEYLYKTYKDQIYISLMNQYTPLKHVAKYPELNRPLSPKHYDYMVDYALAIGIENGFIQEGETNKESFIPPFNEEGVEPFSSN